MLPDWPPIILWLAVLGALASVAALARILMASRVIRVLGLRRDSPDWLAHFVPPETLAAVVCPAVAHR